MDKLSKICLVSKLWFSKMKPVDVMIQAATMRILKELEELSSSLKFDDSSPIASAACQVKNKEILEVIAKKTAYLKILKEI